MKNYSRQERKNFEYLATNQANVKDYGEQGLDELGNLKDGFFQLRDNRVVCVAELLNTKSTRPKSRIDNIDFDIEKEATKHLKKLRDFKGFGKDTKSKKPRNGFYQLQTGEVISLKQLQEIVSEENSKSIDVKDAEKV